MTIAPASPAEGARRPRWGLFAGLAASVVVLDQLAKVWIVANVPPDGPVEVIGDLVRLILSHNTGALFGMFPDQAPVFALFSLGVVGLIVWYNSRVGDDLLSAIALGLLLGGALGNLTDRLRLGYVIDFVDMGIGGWRFYTYNVADSAISLSIVLLLLLALRGERRPGDDRRSDDREGNNRQGNDRRSVPSAGEQRADG